MSWDNKQVVKTFWRKAACHPSRMRVGSTDLDPHLTHCSLNPHKPALKRHINRFSRFAGLTQNTMLYSGFEWAGQPPKTAPSPGVFGPVYTTRGSFGPPESPGILIGSAVFAGHIRMTNFWQTHRHRHTTLRVASVALGRIYVMRPNNIFSLFVVFTRL